MEYLMYVYLGLFSYIVSYLMYYCLSHGLGNKATFLQLRRFVPCAILAVLPMAIGQVSIFAPAFFVTYVIGALWVMTYPLFYYLSNHKVSSDFEFHFEAVFAMYFIGWISGLLLLLSQTIVPATISAVVITVIEIAVLLIPLSQIGYYMLYKACINENGMQMLQETNYNEIIEFFKSMPVVYNIVTLVAIVGPAFAVFKANLAFLNSGIVLNLYSAIAIFAIAIFLTIYLWKKNHGVFVRTGIIEFYLDIKEYLANNSQYAKNLDERMATLEVRSLAPAFDKPSTFVLIIGESESRDYMKAFNDEYKYPTTPWLSAQKNNKNFILFPNAFSSIANTVNAVSRALTEYNQYNDKKFYESCSIIDVARKLGYKIHWYSNQGHLGCADTVVSLIAETADVAKWTKQKLNTVQYDEALLEYLKEVDPEKNNFVVMHLKGNHFNFLNRFPSEFTKFGEVGKYDLEVNYADSIAYTDSVLEKIYDYCRGNLNLQGMVYFSDHATIPDKRRSPNFDGLGIVRIPMFTYFSDEYIAKNEEPYQALVANKDRYWTNDLAYEMLCGILNIESNHYDADNSLASTSFKYKREDLRTNLGKEKI